MSISTIQRLAHERLKKLYDESEIQAMTAQLLSDLLSLSSVNAFFLLDKDTLLSEETKDKFFEAFHRLQQGEPFQYVLGYTYFYKDKLAVGQGVLIPRPETEELVAMALQSIGQSYKDKKLKVLDIGTGSACIPCAIASEMPYAVELTALEVSEEARRIAETNIKTYCEKYQANITLQAGDLFALVEQEPQQSYDMIISNPPYIHPKETEEMHSSVKEFEPSLALFTPEDRPTLFYEGIAMLVSRGYLNKGGEVFLEINPLYAKETLAIMSEIIGESLAKAELKLDLSGKERFIHLKVKS